MLFKWAMKGGEKCIFNVGLQIHYKILKIYLNLSKICVNRLNTDFVLKKKGD